MWLNCLHAMLATLNFVFGVCLSPILCHAMRQHGIKLDRWKQRSVMLPLNTESFNSSRSFPVSGVDLV